ncbi:2-oxoglutarate (2OG) and Fe(II)-dependent oxygenase superfamily protein [Hibiscus syriacus]|uniref:2-oxoglutarate (2OG) and Fe(II)-dependent oxygenase superfamily protein n=1 Tax=Hibiscus syriacus TaxID=106335 RepID=A0A6A2YN58_HIBSY|nr:2-oxoglutarate (2OG) and Fe(II)-dependent oxygenase superfamily protein [Hibiscus syriacus]
MRSTKSVRKPLRDLTNNESTMSLFKSEIPKKKIIPKNSNNQSDSSLDRLLLLHSDLSSFLRQIDEFVVQAFKLKAAEQGRKEIESFMDVISNMPWVPKFHKAFSSLSAGEHKDQPGKHLEAETVSFIDTNGKECFDVGSPEETTLDSLISPSPLVSWRPAGCNVGRGRQLFLLTPLSMSKAMSSRRDENDDLVGGAEIKATPVRPSCSIMVKTDNTLKRGFVSSPVSSKRDHPVFVMTPCLKMSPPKSCVLLEPIQESWDRSKFVVQKSTPYPFGINNSCFFESSGSEEASEDLTLKYPELRGIQPTFVPEIRKKELESSPTWLFSPPKSCILLEPPDEKSLDKVGTDHHLRIISDLNQQPDMVFSKQNGVTDACQESKTINQGNNLAPVESSPMWKEPQSTMRRGKHAGESTLKKELWTKFEAASTYGPR